MKRTLTLRQTQEHKRRAAMGIALIERPLRFIRSRIAPGAESYQYQKAAQAAANGHGGFVQYVARSFL